VTAGHRETERRRDWDFLLQACRAEVAGLGARVADRFPGRRAGDWDGFLGLMDNQGAALLAGSALLSVDEDVLPEEVRAALKDRIRLGALRAKIQVPELLAILEAFQRRGIDAVAHKGPALSALAYGRAGVRDSVDLDLLVHESDVTAAEQALRERGYRRNSPGDLSPREEAGWRKAWNETEFVSADGWTFVDLHWRICPERFPFRVDGPRLWSRRHRVALGGGEVPVFPAESQVVLLCVHGAKDTWHKLIWLCDVDRVIRAFPSLDWEEVRAIAEEGRCRRAVGLGLLLANRLLRTPVPAAGLGRLAVDERLERLAAEAEDQLASGEIRRPPWLAHFDVLPLHLQVFDTWLDAVPYVGRTLVTPRAWDWEVIKLRLPDSLYALRYPARLARLIVTFPREALRRGRRLQGAGREP
jgi:Uncharacterised nucleotidyltransferase